MKILDCIENLIKKRDKAISGFLIFILLAVYAATVYIGAYIVGPTIHSEEIRKGIIAISTIDVLEPAREELSLFGFYVDSLLKASAPIFYTMGFFGLLAALLTNKEVYSALREAVGFTRVKQADDDSEKESQAKDANDNIEEKSQAENLNQNIESENSPESEATDSSPGNQVVESTEPRESDITRSIYVVLILAKIKMGAGYFLPALLCVIYGGLAIGTSVYLMFAQKLAGQSSFMAAIAAMMVLVFLAILGFRRATIDLRKATLLSAFLSLFMALGISIYGLTKDIKTKVNVLKISQSVVELVRENEELKNKLKRLEP